MGKYKLREKLEIFEESSMNVIFITNFDNHSLYRWQLDFGKSKTWGGGLMALVRKEGDFFVDFLSETCKCLEGDFTSGNR